MIFRKLITALIILQAPNWSRAQTNDYENLENVVEIKKGEIASYTGFLIPQIYLIESEKCFQRNDYLTQQLRNCDMRAIRTLQAPSGPEVWVISGIIGALIGAAITAVVTAH
jgi:hypothetical protein